MIRLDHVEALVIQIRPTVGVICTVKNHEARGICRTHPIKQIRQRNAGPLPDTAPTLDAIVTSDLGSRGHLPKRRQRQRHRLFDQPVDGQTPVGESILDPGTIVILLRVGSAIGTKHRRDLTLVELLGECLARGDQTLGLVRELLDVTQRRAHGRAFRQSIATGEEGASPQRAQATQ